jgi:hypothetical protein
MKKILVIVVTLIVLVAVVFWVISGDEEEEMVELRGRFENIVGGGCIDVLQTSDSSICLDFGNISSSSYFGRPVIVKGFNRGENSYGQELFEVVSIEDDS